MDKIKSYIDSKFKLWKHWQKN